MHSLFHNCSFMPKLLIISCTGTCPVCAVNMSVHLMTAFTLKLSVRGGSRRGRGGRAPPPREKKKVVDLLLRACTWHALQANVREQRLVNARASVPHVDSSNFYSFRRLSVSGLRLTQKSEVSAWTFVEV